MTLRRDQQDSLASKARNRLLEMRSIEPVPDDERHGTRLRMFAIFFGFNAGPLTIITGLLATLIYHLPLLDAFAALLIGNFAGAVLMGLHSAQGTRLGVPQMIQSRGQFGSIGSILIYAVVFLVQVGFAASILVVGGQSASAAAPAVSENVWIVICTLATLGIAILGHDVLHLINKYLMPISVATIFMVLAGVLSQNLPTDLLGHGTLTLGGFLGTIALAAVYQITFAPFVSDYSRYMPHLTRRNGSSYTFPTAGSTYFGTVSGAGLFMLLGALIGVVLPSATGAGGIDKAVGAGALGAVLMVIFVLNSIDAAALNLYSFGLVLVTLVATFTTSIVGRARVAGRSAFITLGTVVAFILAVAFRTTFLVNYTQFLALLFYLMIPWSIINLLDFYVVTRGNYDTASFYAADGGIYGRVRWPAFLVYLAGVAIQIPFMNLAFYESPVAKALNGGDISWLVALVLVPPMYLLVARRTPVPLTSEPTSAGAVIQAEVVPAVEV